MQTETVTKKKPKPAGPKPKRFTQKLEVALTDKEILERTQNLVEAMQSRDALKSQKSDQTSLINAEIKMADERVKEIANACRSKKENRDVECYEEWTFATNTAAIFRADTKEKIGERALTLDERQEKLPLVDAVPPADLGKGKKADRPESTDGICTAELDGVRCLRKVHARGAHSWAEEITSPAAVLAVMPPEERPAKRARKGKATP